jgi:myo-inositol-1-phosphate synthase
MGGPIIPACAYLMKHPPKQMSDPQAKIELEKFIKN